MFDRRERIPVDGRRGIESKPPLRVGQGFPGVVKIPRRVHRYDGPLVPDQHDHGADQRLPGLRIDHLAMIGLRLNAAWSSQRRAKHHQCRQEHQQRSFHRRAIGDRSCKKNLLFICSRSLEKLIYN